MNKKKHGMKEHDIHNALKRDRIRREIVSQKEWRKVFLLSKREQSDLGLSWAERLEKQKIHRQLSDLAGRDHRMGSP